VDENQFMWKSKARPHILFSASFLLLAACGGGGNGGGGPGSPPPPPPPPAGSTNAAPILRATVDDAAPQEGQYFTLDASGTTDADNDPLTFSWVQTAGPHVDIPDPTLATLTNLRVPELTETKVAKFRVQVEDGKAARSVYVDVTFTNIHQMPRFAPDPQLIASIPIDGYVTAVSDDVNQSRNTVLGVAATPGGDLSIRLLRHTAPDVFELVPGAQAVENFLRPLKLLSGRRIQSDSWQFYALAESSNRLVAYARPLSDTTSQLTEKSAFPISSPCAILEPDWDPRQFVGQRHGGFSVLKQSVRDGAGKFTYSRYQQVGTTESFCALADANYPISEGTAFDGSTANILQDMLAYDVDSNMISVFEEDDGLTVDTVEYRFRDKEPVQLESSTPLTFVKAVPVHVDNGFARGMALLFTDGQHVGNHRLVIVGLNPAREIVQQTISWTTGVPTDVVSFYSRPGPDVMLSLAVISSTSPEAMVFAPAYAADPAKKWVMPMSGPEYFEVGLGANLGHLESFVGTGSEAQHLMISDNESQEMRIYGPLY
jgi:hypothetical protein